MIRACFAIALLLFGTAAHAQPAPRVTLDVEIKLPDGFQDAGAFDHRLAVQPDGTIIVALRESSPARAGADIEAMQVEVIAFDHDGRQKFRTVPLRLQESAIHARVDWPYPLGVGILSSGDIAIVSGANLPGNGRARWLRLAADGTVRQTAVVPAPDNTPDPDRLLHYKLDFFLPAPDGGMLLAGSFGADPNAWWLGKLTPDGKRAWQGWPGPGFPERVLDVGLRADGSWVVLLFETRGPDGAHRMYVDVYGKDGRRLSRRALPLDLDKSLADLPEGAAVTLDKNHNGRLRDVGQNVDRLDRDGKVRWRLPSLSLYTGNAVTTSNGEVLTLRPGDAVTSLRLLRYADP